MISYNFINFFRLSVLPVAVLFSAFVSSAQAADSLIFTNVAAGALATGFADRNGDDSAGLLWGVVVDAQGNEINSVEGDYGFILEKNLEGTVLNRNHGGPDDILFLPSFPTVTRTGDGAFSSGVVTTLPSIQYNNGVGAGDQFAIIWFDRGTEVGDSVGWNRAFGLLTAGRNPSPEFVLPTDGFVMDFSSAFLGVDPIKTPDHVWVPEPSSAILVGLGGLVLLRRRR